VSVIVGVFEAVGVSVGGAAVLVEVAESAAEVCIADQVSAATVSRLPGASGTVILDDEIPQAIKTSTEPSEISAMRFCCLSIDPPKPIFLGLILV
jgi:hypothetical protein